MERLDAQLEEFYGPLYAIFEGNRIAHRRFVEVLRPGSNTLFAPQVKPSTLKDSAYGACGLRALIDNDLCPLTRS